MKTPFFFLIEKGHEQFSFDRTEARAKKDEAASSILPMLTNVASFAGLDAKTCVQRSVCETYRNPERYGYLVLPIRYFML